MLYGRSYGKAVVSEEPGAASPVWVPIGMKVPTVAEPPGQGPFFCVATDSGDAEQGASPFSIGTRHGPKKPFAFNHD